MGVSFFPLLLASFSLNSFLGIVNVTLQPDGRRNWVVVTREEISFYHYESVRGVYRWVRPVVVIVINLWRPRFVVVLC